jgi:hypothetical protein
MWRIFLVWRVLIVTEMLWHGVHDSWRKRLTRGIHMSRRICATHIVGFVERSAIVRLWMGLVGGFHPLSMKVSRPAVSLILLLLKSASSPESLSPISLVHWHSHIPNRWNANYIPCVRDVCMRLCLHLRILGRSRGVSLLSRCQWSRSRG